MLTRSVTRRRIGPWGTGARAIVGAAMVVGAFIGGVERFDAGLGLLAFPLTVSAFVALRGPSATPIRLTGLEGHCLNCALIVGVFVLAPVAAFLFYGTSMLVAAARGYGGCELFALSNWLWRRDDQIACPVFHAVDLAERRALARKAA
jgi:hypothetical protein